MSTAINEAQWREFDPGFEHGEVEHRAPNIEGVIGSAEFATDQFGGADVREPNCVGRIGDADFSKWVKTIQTPMGTTQVGCTRDRPRHSARPRFG